MNGPGSTLFPLFCLAPSLYSIWFWVCSVGKTATVFYSFSCISPLCMDKLKNNHVFYSFHSVSLPKSERRPDRAESSRSCESVSSWMKTCMATWSGSLTLKSWMLTKREKVSTVNHLSTHSTQRYCWTHNCYSLVRAPAFDQWRFWHRQPI